MLAPILAPKMSLGAQKNVFLRLPVSRAPARLRVFVYSLFVRDIHSLSSVLLVFEVPRFACGLLKTKNYMFEVVLLTCSVLAVPTSRF